MLLETPYFVVDLPDDYVVGEADGIWSATHDGEFRELTITSMSAPTEAPLDRVLETLADVHRQTLRDDAGATSMTPLEVLSRQGQRLASFLAEAAQPQLAFCAFVTHEEPVLDQRTLVTLCIYQYGEPGVPPTNEQAFQELARSIRDTVQVVPQRAALQRSAAAGEETDPTRVYPYLVPVGYLEARNHQGRPPRHLGHDVYVALAEDFDGAARVSYPEDRPGDEDAARIFGAAQQNLVRAVMEGKVPVTGFQTPRGLPALLFGPEWLAASCLLLPDLYQLAARHLGEGPLCASIPHREAMILFRQEDAAYRREMQALIDESEAWGRKRLTRDLFAITAAGIEPLTDPRSDPSS
jgi:hypothetical protein